MVVRYYIDVSGKQADHRVVAAAGYIASEDQWAAFEGEWGAILRDAMAPSALRAPPFHATDFFNCRRDFKHLERGSPFHTELARRFARAAYTHTANGYATGLDTAHFDDEMARTFRKVKTPHGRMRASTLAVAHICTVAARHALLLPGGPEATVFVEEGDGVGEIIEWLWHLKRVGEPSFAPYLNFAPVPKSEPAVQAADFLAYESWLEITGLLKQPGRSWDVTRETFKILATGPEMDPPGTGYVKVTLQMMGLEDFRASVPDMRAFLIAHPEYGHPRGHRRKELKRRLREMRRRVRKFVVGRLKRFWYGFLRRGR